MVEVDGAGRYPVFFYRPGRLQFELEMSSRHGHPYIAEPGMIILPELSLEAMQAAVQRLCDEGYFDYLIPLTPEQVSNVGSFEWPP